MVTIRRGWIAVMETAVRVERPSGDEGSLERLVERAAVVASLHIDEEGLCRGCLDLGRLALPQCVSAAWAAAVLAEYGTPRQEPG
ncbi:hypothetical protein HCB17_07915 [Salinispora arenicola]|uniref:hypothetical protein n=1 Tax=Salinispora arenicola TaxID=168697 RepID=UPI00037BFA6D|nr:hypothetical protein [Salinispora arenicola]NIL41105.1 hypothetical protein [Salinispora arenicola]